MLPVMLCALLWLVPPGARREVRPRARQERPVRRVYRPRRVVRSWVEITPDRALQIQQALMAAGYLSIASGHWDAATEAALRKYQLDHHWQTRYVPDARALIALGLGPAQDRAYEEAERADPPRRTRAHGAGASRSDQR